MGKLCSATWQQPYWHVPLLHQVHRQWICIKFAMANSYCSVESWFGDKLDKLDKLDEKKRAEIVSELKIPPFSALRNISTHLAWRK